jgi:hypothetical protein
MKRSSELLSWLLLAAPLAADAVVADESRDSRTPDILGIRLGTSYEEVAALARKRHPGGMHVLGEWKSDGTPTVPVRFFYQSSLSGGALGRRREILHVAFAASPSPSAAVEVMREESFEQNKEPEYEVVFAGLVEKYGLPSFVDRTKQTHVWFLDGNVPDDAAQREQLVERCEPVGNAAGRSLDSYVNDLDRSSSVMYNPKCGRTLYVSIRLRATAMFQPGGNLLAESMGLVLTDHEAGLQAHKLTRQMVEEGRKRYREENVRKPDL